jgi:DNA primase
MEFFKKFFKTMHELDNGEAAVLCPFPHTNEKGQQYFESVPSAHINLSQSLFHCKVCGQGMSEAAFLSKIQGISYKDALVLLKEMDKHRGNHFREERQSFLNNRDAQSIWTGLGLDLTTAEQLTIGYSGEGIDFPVIIYGELLDIRNYMPGRKPKVMSRRGAKNLLLPFDLWREDERPTLLCAGEKDMAIARQNGFNAITFTGGERAFPKLFKASFKNKRIFIAYDNDQAGHEGSRNIASLLKDCGAFPHVVTGHYAVCTEKGEDIHDFFTKYNRTSEELQKILDAAPEFTEEEYREEQQRYIPLVTIEEASQGKYSNRLVSSRVSVVATYEEMFQVPEYVELEKFDAAPKGNTMDIGERREWALDESNAKDILLLMDSNLKEEQVRANMKVLSRIPPKESHIRQIVKSKTNIFKAVVMDDLETEVVEDDEKGRSMTELLVYSIGEKVRSGEKYRIFYKPVPHPLKGQQIVGVITAMEESDNSISRFEVNDRVIESLKCFQVKEGETVKQKMNELYERTKGFAGVETRKDVAYTTDLFYHTPLKFKFGRRTERATLDVMVVGDPRSGKSQTAKAMREMYELGLIASLKTTTEAGLVGGSDQTSGGWKTKLGLIPRNHKGAIILEEFSGGGQGLVSRLTEVRSSGRLRIGRVNGSIDVPAMVRMMSISNPAKDSHGNTNLLRNYPNGVRILLDLVGASEDIARYDFFLLVNDPENYINPLDEFDLEPFPKESYLNRVRWVWSRKAEQVQMDRETMEHIVKLAEDLNRDYNTHIKFFGPEAWKKLARISIATAGLLASMDETGQNLIVTKEHVDWAKSFLVACYDNRLFKLKEYVQAQRKLTECDPQAVHALEGIYRQHSIMLQQLEMATEISQKDLQSISGLEPKEFPKVLNTLAKMGFVHFPSSGKIVPTTRFREAMSQIDKDQYLKRVGEW